MRQFGAEGLYFNKHEIAAPGRPDEQGVRKGPWSNLNLSGHNGCNRRLSATLACGGESDGIRLLSIPTIEKSIEQQCYGRDLVLDQPIRWGLGWGLKSKEMPLGPNEREFYWGGRGGSAVVIDLDARMSFAYVMNKMTAGSLGDTRVVGPAMALLMAMM